MPVVGVRPHTFPLKTLAELPVTASVAVDDPTLSEQNRVLVSDLIAGAGATPPGGADTQVQFNNAGAFGGSANLTYDGTTLNVAGALTVSGVAAFGDELMASVFYGAGAGLTGVPAASLVGVVAVARGGLGVALADPGADRLLFRDHSAGEFAWLELGTNLSITGTTLNAAAGGSPGGADTQFQYNAGGAFGGVAAVTWTGTAMVVTADLIARQSGGVAGTDEVVLRHTGARAELDCKDGAIRFVTPGGPVANIEIATDASTIPVIRSSSGVWPLFLQNALVTIPGDTSGWKANANGAWVPSGNTWQIFWTDVGISRVSAGRLAVANGTGGPLMDVEMRAVFLSQNSEPADSALAASQVVFWLDDTPGATKLKIKAKDSGGTVRRGEVVLA